MIETYMQAQEAIGVRLATQLFEVAAKTKDSTVYACATMMSRKPAEWQTVVVEMAQAQAMVLRTTLDSLRDMTTRYSVPPILLVPEDRMDINLSDGQVVAADEWPATERAVIELSRRVYFQDFLRSFWKRLTKR